MALSSFVNLSFIFISKLLLLFLIFTYFHFIGTDKQHKSHDTVNVTVCMKITGYFPAAVRDTESTILVMWKQLFQSLYPVVFPVKAASTADAARP